MYVLLNLISDANKATAHMAMTMLSVSSKKEVASSY